MPRSFFLATLLGLLAVACGENRPGQTNSDAGVDTATSTTVFEPCAVQGVPRAECATLSVPLDWNNVSDTRRINTHVIRVRARQENAPDVWLLQGGPGGSGRGLAETLAAGNILRTIDGNLYFLDHRGTGDSNLVQCAISDQSSGAVRNCSLELNRVYGDDFLDFINSEQSSRDLHAWIENTRGRERKVAIYAVSYGTYWLSRFLEFFPNGVDGAISDGLFFGAALRDLSLNHDRDSAMLETLQACARDTDCNAALGSDPIAFATRLNDAFDRGHCPELGDTADRKSATALFIATSYANFVPAILARIERCAPEDLQAIQSMASLFSGGRSGMLPSIVPSPFKTQQEGIHYVPHPLSSIPQWQLAGMDERSFSIALNLHITLNEIVARPTPSPDTATLAGIRFHRTNSDRTLLEIAQNWQDHTPLATEHVYPTTSIPWLLWNGTLDFQTPLVSARAMSAGTGRPLDVFEGSGHAVLAGGALVPENGPCAVTMFNDFVANPRVNIDRTCLARLEGPSFAESPRLARWLFQTSSLYPNPTATHDSGVVNDAGIRDSATGG